ncbi:hypothetical protein G7085_17760 [Tessaracoccus sp. HDW20]|uniref:DUF2231 domain-containing protein n=1 Tax=Tessaracoccus coleopterorum TaxID=2714950 RepID=UPI0018D4B73E|nr:DUF2231 domain-containing protein [Tessaracoccus coleopterorum]NHB85791.1 hypothetical protein [Tessaracoccus coleopterorum]
MFGLPLHPLVVHAAVVFIPLAALGAVLVVLMARVRERYAGLTVTVGVLAVIAAFAARLTGPLLADHLGLAGTALIARHQSLGSWMPWVTLLLAVALPLHLLARRAARDGTGPGSPSAVPRQSHRRSPPSPWSP